jgi:hypothetical protein
MTDRKPDRVIVAGIDGMSHNLTRRLLEAGKLPVIGRLVGSGLFFRYHSLERYASPAIWTSLSTGFLPVDHGVSTFYQNYSDLKVPFIWEVLHDCYDMPVGVLGDFSIWPPRELRQGFVIPDMVALDDSACPPEYGFLKRLIDRAREKKLGIRDLIANGMLIARYAGLKTTVELASGFLGRKLRRGDTQSDGYHLRVFKQKLNLEIFLRCVSRFRVRYALIHNHLLDWTSH